MYKWYLLLCLFIIFCKWFFSDNEFNTLNMYMGKMGVGKTTHICRESQRYIKKGYKVYCNVEIPGTYLYNPLELNQYTFEKNSVVFCDEIGIIFNNRSFKSFDKGYIEFFKMIRQYKVKFICYSQALDSDKIIRNLMHNIYIMNRIGKITLIRPISKNFGLATDENGNGQIVDSYKFKSILEWKFIYLPRYYGMFKSYNPPYRELIKSTYYDYNEITSIFSDTKKWLLYKIKHFINISNIVNKIKYRKPTATNKN